MSQIIDSNWPKAFSQDNIWSDDDLITTRGILKSIDKKNRLNSKAFFMILGIHQL